MISTNFTVHRGTSGEHQSTLCAPLCSFAAYSFKLESRRQQKSTEENTAPPDEASMQLDFNAIILYKKVLSAGLVTLSVWKIHYYQSLRRFKHTAHCHYARVSTFEPNAIRADKKLKNLLFQISALCHKNQHFMMMNNIVSFNNNSEPKVKLIVIVNM